MKFIAYFKIPNGCISNWCVVYGLISNETEHVWQLLCGFVTWTSPTTGWARFYFSGLFFGKLRLDIPEMILSSKRWLVLFRTLSNHMFITGFSFHYLPLKLKEIMCQWIETVDKQTSWIFANLSWSLALWLKHPHRYTGSWLSQGLKCLWQNWKGLFVNQQIDDAKPPHALDHIDLLC